MATASAAETREIGRRLAAELPDDAVVALSGDLGAGKTELVKGLASGLDVPDEITSPTFNIFTIHEGKCRLIHLDAYRLEDAGQMEPLMLEDFLLTPYCLAIEWPEKITAWLPAGRIDLRLEISPDGTHFISMKSG